MNPRVQLPLLVAIIRSVREHPEADELAIAAYIESLAEQIFEDGIRAVLSIRCMNHRAVPQMNSNEATGAECAVCAVETELGAARSHERAMRDIRGRVP